MDIWTRVLDLWRSCLVQDIEVVPFDLSQHHPHEPWMNRTSRLAVHTSNPQHATAYHLAVLLRDQDPEVVAAYKMLAYGVEHRRYVIERGPPISVYQMTAPVLERHGIPPGGWWHSSARLVIPSVRVFEDERDHWQEWVPAAARNWNAVAAEYAIVRIPDLTEPGSPERQAYDEYSA